jgi:hypothetical protein
MKLTEVVFHEVTPPEEHDNIWQLQNTISQGQAKYAYTWQDFERARAGGYLPISGNHTVATIEFKALGEGTTSLHLSTLKIAGPNGERLIYLLASNYAYFRQGTFSDCTVNVVDCFVADANGDGRVDLYDALSMAEHFGCRIGDVNWDGSVDMNEDQQIDIYDVIILAHAFSTGQHSQFLL